ncbi:hypothetical protein [Actinoplanes sp. NPDC051411]|uniref:hypothetical protein n=1 Tax=Actinoplanes sp. NPDC051411 TaxID=3155522 RepID=UPI003422A563
MSLFKTTNRNLPAQAYPINRIREDPIPDGPTEPLGKRTAKPRVRNWGLLALVVAMFALNVAGVAGLLAWRALKTKAVAAGAGKAVTTVAPEAGGGYAVAYAQEPLRVQVGCSAVMFLDLDEPRANAGESVSDLRYDSRCGDQPPSLTLGPGATAGAQVGTSDIDAAGCGDAVRTRPLGPGASVQVRKGAALCVLTAASPPDMVLIEVTDVAQTGIAGMRATSWKVTG